MTTNTDTTASIDYTVWPYFRPGTWQRALQCQALGLEVTDEDRAGLAVWDRHAVSSTSKWYRRGVGTKTQAHRQARVLTNKVVDAITAVITEDEVISAGELAACLGGVDGLPAADELQAVLEAIRPCNHEPCARVQGKSHRSMYKWFQLGVHGGGVHWVSRRRENFARVVGADVPASTPPRGTQLCRHQPRTPGAVNSTISIHSTLWEGPTTMARNNNEDMDAVGRRIYGRGDDIAAVGKRIYHGSDELDAQARRIYGVTEDSSLDEQGARMYGAGSTEVNTTGHRVHYGLEDKGAISHSQLPEHNNTDADGGRQAADRAGDEPMKLDEVRYYPDGGYEGGQSLTPEQAEAYGPPARGRYTTKSVDNRGRGDTPGLPGFDY